MKKYIPLIRVRQWYHKTCAHIRSAHVFYTYGEKK